LAKQIRAGAPFDAFLSADVRLVRELEEAGLVSKPVIYATGRLGVWSAKGLGWGDLASGRVTHLAIANPAHAPYGRAAKQALERAGLWERIEGKVVYGENVRQAMQYAASGNADVVVTAWSLVREKGGALVEATLHDPIEQGAAVVKRSAKVKAAERFLEFLVSAEGARILGRHGLDAPVVR
jgi:molybdate transport system substrate-binding protein